MWGILGTLGSAIIGGISNHFEDKRELQKIEVEAQKKVIIAKAEAEVEMAKNGQQQEYDLDRIATEDMKKSLKDEIVMAIFYAPLIMSFIPMLAPYALEGFTILKQLPEWYMYLVVGITVVTMGMRGMLTKFIGIISNKVSFSNKNI